HRVEVVSELVPEFQQVDEIKENEGGPCGDKSIIIRTKDAVRLFILQQPSCKHNRNDGSNAGDVSLVQQHHQVVAVVRCKIDVPPVHQKADDHQCHHNNRSDGHEFDPGLL